MKPSPGKLAVLMSLTGLGLSLGELAQAKSDPSGAANPIKAFGLEGSEDYASALGDGWSSIPSGPLDVTLSSVDAVAVPSKEDRAAIALAMVLMADAPDWEPTLGTREPSPSESASTPSATASASTPTSTSTSTEIAEAVRAVEYQTAGDVDFDPTAAPVIDVDLSVAAPDAVALDLDLSPPLDLNLDLASDVDLRLDRPPVFPVTDLKPLGALKSASVPRANEPVSMADTSAEESIAVARAESEAEPTPQVAAPTARQEAPRVAPTIVVATHADRVLRGLEILLTDDPATRPAAAPAAEVFVTSHAEKALLMLASTCAGEASAPLEAEVPRHLSKVEPGPAAPVCRPAAPTARPRPARHSPIGAEAVAMSQGELDRVRGGFQTSNGLQISFGIERAVYINGALVTTTSLNVSELGQMSAGAAAVTSAVAGSGNLTLIQNGAGNTFVTGPVSAATVGTVVQNTLNDQKIQSVTAINATVNSLQMVRAQNFQSTLRGVLTDALRR